jgi:hypothetical protein
VSLITGDSSWNVKFLLVNQYWDFVAKSSLDIFRDVAPHKTEFLVALELSEALTNLLQLLDRGQGRHLFRLTGLDTRRRRSQSRRARPDTVSCFSVSSFFLCQRRLQLLASNSVGTLNRHQKPKQTVSLRRANFAWRLHSQRKIPNLIDNRQHMHPEYQTPFEDLPEVGWGVAAQFALQPTGIHTNLFREPHVVSLEVPQLFTH